MENQLVRTDKFLYKVKRFFRLLFIKNNSQFYKNAENIQNIELKLDQIISCKTEDEEIRIKSGLADKLMKSELSISDLADDEIENMIHFFQDDIKLKSEELELIKNQIIELKQKENSSD